MENVAVVLRLGLREVKFVLLLSDHIFKIIVEWYWHRLTKMLHIHLYKWVEDKEAWFGTAGVGEGSIGTQ